MLLAPTEITSEQRANVYHAQRPVTVDTGGPDDVRPGALLVWLHIPHGGYGYVWPVNAQVVSHGRRPSARVTIEVEKRNGERVRRVVDASNLRWRK